MTQSNKMPSMLPHIQALETYEGVDPMEVMAERAGISPDKIIRLNGNENPYGPSPKVASALGDYENYNYYPDPGQRNLRRVLSGYLNVEPEKIVAGNGSDELIDLLLRHGVTPLMVFDGARLPAKAGTEASRGSGREQAKAQAKALLAAGQRERAMDFFHQAVDITPAHARQLILALRARGLSSVVAPYEADAQMALLARRGDKD